MRQGKPEQVPAPLDEAVGTSHRRHLMRLQSLFSLERRLLLPPWDGAVRSSKGRMADVGKANNEPKEGGL